MLIFCDLLQEKMPEEAAQAAGSEDCNSWALPYFLHSTMDIPAELHTLQASSFQLDLCFSKVSLMQLDHSLVLKVADQSHLLNNQVT